MKMHPTLLATALLLTLAACGSPVSDYTSSEAAKQLTLNDASHSFVVRFIPGSDRLASGDAARLRRMAATGAIRASDRLAVSPAGPPGLAARRVVTLSSEMLRYGIIVSPVALAEVPRDSAIVEVGRYLVTLPPCPDWSGPAAADFTNMSSSNFGCATVSNFGEMVASPTDLASGQPLGLAAGMPAAAAVNRYKTDKVILPTPTSSLPLAAPSTAAPGAGNSSGS
ncbi:MAG TPA: CpaD family pilus assembly lipoprotein [Stellaceae bacterium]|jgi:pilus assembly protein CpaD|nr:CpaD family pilus assembly lipoprotein [Stellaceae bacterium]